MRMTSPPGWILTVLVCAIAEPVCRLLCFDGCAGVLRQGVAMMQRNLVLEGQGVQEVLGLVVQSGVNG